MKISKIVAGVLLALSVIATGCGNVKEEENKVEEKTEVSEVSSVENETEEKVIIGWINADTTTPSQIAKLNAAKEQAKQMNAELRVMDYQHDINKMIESGWYAVLEIKPLEGDETNDIHLLWMLHELTNNTEQSETKKHRWLGYVQGVMTVKSYITVLEEREFTRSILNGA